MDMVIFLCIYIINIEIILPVNGNTKKDCDDVSATILFLYPLLRNSDSTSDMSDLLYIAVVDMSV